MKILVLYNKIPYPIIDGGTKSVSNDILAFYENDFKVDLLCFNTSKHYVSKDNINIPDHVSNYEALDLDNSVKLWPLFKSFFTGKLYNVSRYENNTFKEILISYLVNFSYDFVVFEGIYMHSYVPIVRKYSKAQIILRPQNIEYMIWKDFSKKSFSIYTLVYFIIYKKFKKYEEVAFKAYDYISPVSFVDADIICNSVDKSKIHTVIGLHSLKVKKQYKDKIENYFHLGAMDWVPNKNGVLWFLENIYPSLKEKFPHLNFSFAGLNMPKEILKYNNPPNLNIESYVEYAITYMINKDVMIVPLMEGSGFRVKVLEAFDLGILVIATKKAMQGIEAEDGVHYLKADTKEEFIKAIESIENGSIDILKITNSASELFLNKYNIDKNIAGLIEFIQK